MKEIEIKDKQNYLDKNYPFKDTPKLTHLKRCIHCDCVIVVGEFKVYVDKAGNEFICCPNAPECNGSVIDWIELN